MAKKSGKQPAVNSHKGKSWGRGRPRTPVTKVPILYRRAYNSRIPLPKDVEKTMRSEVSRMRGALLKRQQRIAESGEFAPDQALIADLKNLTLRNTKSTSRIWNTWSRLRSLMGAENTSLSGRRATVEREVRTFHENGIDWMTKDLLPKFGLFMQWTKDTFSSRAFGSGRVVKYFEENRELSLNELESKFTGWLYSNG